MRAGLLSEPAVVVALRTLFVPVHLSALNTPQCMHDPRDAGLLAKYAGPQTDRFQGGEREAFILPNGEMQRVFMSLSGQDVGEHESRASHATAAARRDASVTRLFRHHSLRALRAVHGDVPAEWATLWDGTHADLAAVKAAALQPPVPPPGQQGLRVFVRNSHLRYDDLHGAQVVPLPDDAARRWAPGLNAPGDRAELPRDLFDALANALVPRGTVDPHLSSTSIGGKLRLTADAFAGDLVRGTVSGDFVLHPQLQSEMGRRPSARTPFHVTGRFTGRFTWDRAANTFRELRAVATDVQFDWKPVMRTEHDFPPHYRAAVEWVRGAAPAR